MDNMIHSGKTWEAGRLVEGNHTYSLNLTHPKYGEVFHNGSVVVTYQPTLTAEPEEVVIGETVRFAVDAWGSRSNATIEEFLVGGQAANPQGHAEAFTVSQIVKASTSITLDDGRHFNLDETVRVFGRATIHASSTSIEEGESITYSVDSVGIPDPMSIAWRTGGGNTQRGETATWRYPDAGTYEVHVTVSGPNGAVARDDIAVTVLPPPPPPEIDSTIEFLDWENAYYDDVAVLAKTWQEGTLDEEGQKSWLMEAKSDAGWTFQKSVPCSPSRTGLQIMAFDSRSNLIDTWNSDDEACVGENAAFKIRLSPGGTLTVTQLF